SRNTDKILAQLKADLEMARNRTGVPGMSVAVMHKGKLIFAEGFGKRNQKDPFTPETRSMIGSLTKAFTATTIGELVAEGKMDWDTTPVNAYLTDFITIDPILTSQLTMQNLLSHRTNFPSLDINWFWGKESRRDLIKRIRYVETKSKLTTSLNYHNVMYAVAGEAAARVAGVPIEQLVRNKILCPLGLTNTGFTMDELRNSPNFAVPFMADSYKDAVAGQFIELPMDGGTEKTAAAGDIYSDILDLVRWGQVIMMGGQQYGKQVLSKDGVDTTLTAHTIFNPAMRDPDFGLYTQYGMGWLLNSYKGNNFFEHSGSVFGYITDLAVFPNAELVVATLTNSHLTALPAFMKFRIADDILGLYKSHDWLVNATKSTQAHHAMNKEDIKGKFPKRVPNKPPVHDLSMYVGDYVHPGHGTTTVHLKEGKLHISLGAFIGVLTHYHFESFATVLRHTTEAMGQLVTFNTGGDGNVSGVTLAPMGPTVTYKKKVEG
ncbi:hypothetical protein CPC16_010322, partial [Podila verticillata]